MMAGGGGGGEETTGPAWEMRRRGGDKFEGREGGEKVKDFINYYQNYSFLTDLKSGTQEEVVTWVLVQVASGGGKNMQRSSHFVFIPTYDECQEEEEEEEEEETAITCENS